MNEEKMMTFSGYSRPFETGLSPEGKLFVCGFGDGTVKAGDFNLGGLQGPHSVDWDKDGALYVCEFYGRRVQKMTSGGSLKPFITDMPGPATAYFNLEKTRLYVTDFNASSVVIYDLDGQAIGEIEGEFNRPHACAFDSEGYVYVADTHNHRLQKFDRAGNFVRTIGGGRLVQPVALSIEDGFIYTAEYCSDQIKRFNLEGKFIDVVLDGLLHPYGVKIKNGTLYVADSDHHCVKVLPVTLPVPE